MNDFDLTKKLQQHAFSQATYRDPASTQTLTTAMAQDNPNIEDKEKAARR